jgi:hypothetical protein
MKLRNSDSLRLALLYQSGLIVTLKTVDGALVQSLQLLDYDCTLGCSIVYPSNIIYIFGIDSASSKNLGIMRLDPDTGVQSLYWVDSLPLITMRNPLAALMLDGRWAIYTKTTASKTLLTVLDSTTTQIKYVYESISGYEVKAADFISLNAVNEVHLFSQSITNLR